MLCLQFGGLLSGTRTKLRAPAVAGKTEQTNGGNSALSMTRRAGPGATKSRILDFLCPGIKQLTHFSCLPPLRLLNPRKQGTPSCFSKGIKAGYQGWTKPSIFLVAFGQWL